MYFGKCRSKVKVSENDLERSNISKGHQVTYCWKGNCWLLFELNYILCPKVENFDKYQKSLKCCSFINNDDNELKLGVC